MTIEHKIKITSGTSENFDFSQGDRTSLLAKQALTSGEAEQILRNRSNDSPITLPTGTKVTISDMIFQTNCNPDGISGYLVTATDKKGKSEFFMYSTKGDFLGMQGKFERVDTIDNALKSEWAKNRGSSYLRQFLKPENN